MDWFGYDVKLSNDGEGSVVAEVQVSEQAMFYWSMQYGESIEVLTPDSLRERVGAAAKSIAEKYGM